jgi:hypothetical protein
MMMGEPRITVLATFDVSAGETFAVVAPSVEDAADLIMEESFRRHQEAERLAREAEAAAEEAEFQAAVAREREAREAAELFWLSDRSTGKFP